MTCLLSETKFTPPAMPTMPFGYTRTSKEIPPVRLRSLLSLPSLSTSDPTIEAGPANQDPVQSTLFDCSFKHGT